MRYDSWDVILFPRDSLVPIQEFRTACYAAQHEQGRQLQTLTCYISSLPPSTPFRISVHSWAAPAKPSALIEARKKANQRVVFTTQVFVDGARVFHGFYEVNSKWPQEIMKEKRSIMPTHIQSSRRSNFLEFPPFHQDILWQSAWDAREHTGRIKVLLSEQLVRKSSSPGELDLGPAIDIVCFAFQHAPRDILEQAGIAWPIKNPLYLGEPGRRGLASAHATMPYTKAPDFTMEARPKSPSLHNSPSTFSRPRNPEPFPRSRTDPPKFSQFPKPPAKSHRTVDPFNDPFDDMSLEAWTPRAPSSQGTGDISMPDMSYSASLYKSREFPWPAFDAHSAHNQRTESAASQTRPDKSARQVVVTLRDDQLGQIIEALSPPKPPKMAPMPVTTRPSAASLARTASYHDLPGAPFPTTSTVNPNPHPKSKHPAATANPEFARPPTAFPHANRVPTPHPFVPVPPHHAALPPAPWDDDVSMRDSSSVFSGAGNADANVGIGKGGANAGLGVVQGASPVPVSGKEGGVRSKKEGMNMNACDMGGMSGVSMGMGALHGLVPPGGHIDAQVRPDLGMLPALELDAEPAATTSADENARPVHEQRESDFHPRHSKGMSSLDSTGRLERQLFSALGEELGAFGEGELGAYEGGGGGGEGEESGKAKRKREGTFGGERGGSPVAKMVREEGVCAGGSVGVSVDEGPCLRGGE